MHDWTLLNISMDWSDSTVKISFKNTLSKEVFLIAEGVSDLIVPKKDEWGASVSVNEIIGPVQLEDGKILFSIEMQSGDIISLVGSCVHLPDSI